MTQAYRCDETAIRKSERFKNFFGKKRISFTKNFSACDSRDFGFHLSMVQRKISRMARLAADADIDHRESNDAQRIPRGQCFRTKSAFPLFESCAYASDACFACMT